jgi:hypothetical protein
MNINMGKRNRNASSDTGLSLLLSLNKKSQNNEDLYTFATENLNKTV